LRINGRAGITVDPALLARLAIDGQGYDAELPGRLANTIY
jgi:hypothetical protein